MEIKTDRDFVEQLEKIELAQNKEKIIKKLNNEGGYIEVDGIKYYDERFIKKLLKI
jgi:hypothetical protein